MLSADEKIKILTSIESGAYASQAAFDNLENIVDELTGLEICKSRPYMTARDVQILYHLICVLDGRIEELEKEACR